MPPVFALRINHARESVVVPQARTAILYLSYGCGTAPLPDPGSDMFQPRQVLFTVVLLIMSSGAASARNVQLDSKLNLREGPSLQRRVVMVMPAGATVRVGECRGEWCQVEYRSQRGFANSALLGGGDVAYAAAPQAAPEAAPVATKYDPDDAARVLQWQDREWRDRYLRELEMRRRR